MTTSITADVVPPTGYDRYTCGNCGRIFYASKYQRRIGYGRYCSHKCGQMGRRKPAVERFWPKVRKTVGCWNWTGSISRGYGQISIDHMGTMCYVHRFSWQLHNGPIPADQKVLHKCDNPLCVRPDHLFLGTSNANSKDMVHKGRSLRGERNPKAKLTESDVRQIRELHKAGVPPIKLAPLFKVSKPLIHKIVSREIWTVLAD